VLADRPACDAPALHIDDSRQINEALPGGHVFDRHGAKGPLIGVVQPNVTTEGVRHAVVKSSCSWPLKDVDARLRAALDPEKTTAKYVDLSRPRVEYEARSFTAGGIGTGYPGAVKIAREGSASKRVKEWADLIKFVGDRYKEDLAHIERATIWRFLVMMPSRKSYEFLCYKH
jgi:hypothetical protein